MKIEGQINGFPLIKFKNTRIINSLKSGKIYLNSLKWFREYENELGDVVVGDSYEGMLHINEGELIIKETGEHHKLNDTIIPTVLSNSYVFCMTYIDPKNDKFEFDDEQKEELRNFGDAALVILDSEEFLARIKKAAEEKGYKIYFNKVHYYDEKVDWADIFISLIQGTHNIAFWKRKAYSNQQEFRIVIPVEDYTEDHIELDIGDISDISKIFTTEQVLTMQVKKK